MNKKQLKSRVTEMILDLERIISGVSGQTRQFEELIQFRDELKELKQKIDNGGEIDWAPVVAFMFRLAAYLYSFSSE